MKYEDRIDLYSDRGQLLVKGALLESISPFYNKAIQKIVSLIKRSVVVDLEGTKKSLKKGRVGGEGCQIRGNEIDVDIVTHAQQISKRVEDIVRVKKDDDTNVEVLDDGKKLLVVPPSIRLSAGAEYTSGITATAAAVTQALIDEFDISMDKAFMVKAAIWGRYPQTIDMKGSNLKWLLRPAQENEGFGYALRNILVNHLVAMTGKNAMNATALASVLEQVAMFEMGDAIGPFERMHLLGLAYQGLNANNLTYELVKENGKDGTVGTVIESLVGRAIEDKVIREKETLSSGYKVYTTDDIALWNAYAATGMVAAIMVNVGAARACQGVPSTIIYYNDLLERETSLPGVDFGRATGTAVSMSFFSHSIYGGGGPGIFSGNHIVTRHSKGFVIPVIAAGVALDAGTQSFTPEKTSGWVSDAFAKIPEFREPIQMIAESAKGVKV
nr:McrB [uncultured archaeon]